jgi:putative oxidoreductase
MGFPAPSAMAWIVALTESLGALFLAMGLFTRISSGLLAITMAVAAFVAHADDPFQKKELALAYLAMYLFFALEGGGKYSLDAKIRKVK